MPLPSKCSMVEVWATSVHYSCNHWQMHSVVSELRCQNVSALIPVSPCAQLYSHTWWRACGPWHRGMCGAYTRNAFTLWTPDFKAATFSSHKTTANLPSTNETNIHMVSGSVMQIFFFFFSVNQTIFFLQPCRNTTENPPTPGSLPHLMHTDKPRPFKKVSTEPWNNCDKHGFTQKQRAQWHQHICLNAFKAEWWQNYLSALTLDDHSRMSRFYFKQGKGASYPWIHYHLDDRNGCRLKTKSLRLIRVSSNSCTAPDNQISWYLI